MLKKSLVYLGGVVMLLGIVLLVAYSWIGYKFGDATLFTIVIYMSLPMIGVDMEYFYTGGGVLLSCILLWLFIILRVRRVVAGRSWRAAGLFCCGSFFVLGLSLYLLEARYGIIDFLFPPEPYSRYIDDNYHMFRPDELQFSGQKNNLVLVEWESAESVFLDPAYFSPPLMPRTRELMKQAVSFRGHRQCLGTEFSIAGFVSMMYGMPLRPRATVREEVDHFLQRDDSWQPPLAVDNTLNFRDYTLMGILEQHDYQIALLRAADARFASYDQQYARATDNTDLRDFEYFRTTRDDVPEKQNGWGVNDSFLYERAKEYMSSASQDKPFFMNVQTVNTHNPGFYEPAMPREYGDRRDTIVQADVMLADFVEWILAQPFAARTTIVVVGDHLADFAELGPVTLPPKSERSILAFVINSSKGQPGDIIDRSFATFDLAPTILEAVGATFPGDGFGLGVSLFSDTPTLLEKDGFEQFNGKFLSRSKELEKRYGW